MTVCATWLARDFLAAHHLDPGPPCDHDPSDCPPTPADVREHEARVTGDRDD